MDYSPIGLTRGLTGVAKTAAKQRNAKGAEELAKAALDPKTQRLYSQLIGRGLIGSAIQLLGFAAGAKGLMTGLRDEKDNAGRAADEAAGRPEGAFRLPGSNYWHQVGRISPFGNLLLTGATLAQNMSTPAELPGKALGVGAKTMLDAPMMMGYEMIHDALSNPEAGVPTYLKRQASTLIPASAGMSRLSATVDPLQRDLKDAGWYGDALRHIPGASRSLPARTDVLGRELRQPGYPPLFDPFRTQQERSDPVSQAIASTGMKLGRLPQDKDSDEERDTYRRRSELAGHLYHTGMLEALQSPEYQDAATDKERIAILRKGRDAGGRALSDLTTRDDAYAEATEAEKRVMLDQYLDDVRQAAAR